MRTSSFKHTIPIAIILIFIQSLVVSQQELSWTYSLTFYGEEKIIVSENIARSDGRFLFAKCDEKQLSSKIVCELSLRKREQPDVSQPPEDSYNFEATLTGNHKPKLSSLQIDLLGHGKKALISWNEVNSKTWAMKKYVVIVDLERRTEVYLNSTSPVSNPGESGFDSNVVFYRDEFDLIISDPDKCGLMPKCRMTFNELMQQEGLTLPFPTSLNEVRTVPALPESSEKGFFVFPDSTSLKPGVHSLQLKYLVGSGSVPELDVGSTVRYDPNVLPPIVSNANELFTICGSTNLTTYCNQYKIGAADPFISPRNMTHKNVVAVHNIAGGGFLLLALNCELKAGHSCSSYKVIKVENNHEHRVMANKLFDLQCGETLDQIIVGSKDEGSDVCFYFGCVKEEFSDGQRTQSKFSAHKDCLNFKS